jgi:pSer/pThr/pTyr-binding forkhead associated (FHA) protein
MFKLVIQDDEGKTTVVPLIRDEITIGRKEGNTIRLTERNVSRRHARILRNNGEVQIEDLGSYNGIRVNNARIAERVSLRVSDQVQIGDYKLYLKAEGVEQIDDARTQPVERVDNAPTDVMNVVTAAPAAAAAPPPQPVGVATATPVPGTLIGHPNRTLVSISDSNDGRPVASAAAVAALTAPAGYGKLVVLSSNFAGKEFELSRPQMIIGRTDENDIVVNHRSISRNHAKLVREPDTARYTISDLQSSNGVRVNGQDYGKVELRRGDVIDLGHVRLRFVEPGEDFVFARDAVITDVPDAGSRKGLLIAIILSVLVLAVVGVFFLMRGDKKPDGGGGGTSGGTGPGTASGTGPDVPDAGQVAVVDPPLAPDAAETDNPPVTPDAGSAPSSELEFECVRYQSEKNWADLEGCAQRMKAANHAEWKKYKDRADLETKAGPRITAFERELKERNLKNAKTELEQIPKGVIDYAKLKQRYDEVEGAAIKELIAKLDRVNKGDCKEYERLLQQERNARPARVAAEAQKAVRCTPAQQQQQNPPERCDPETYAEKGKEFHASGQHSAAYEIFEKAYACNKDVQYAEKAFISACNMPNPLKAKTQWRRLPAVNKQRVQNVCVREGISIEQLEAP